MQRFICAVPVSPLRVQASHPSEMVSQLLFGETCTVLDSSNGDWLKVKCDFDQYEGFCQQSHLLPFAGVLPASADQHLASGWVNHILFRGQSMHIPFGSQLTGIYNGSMIWSDSNIHYAGSSWHVGQHLQGVDKLRGLALQFLNSPYLWGGRSVFGLDCSGYTQLVFKFLGIALPRDAWQQAEKGTVVASLGDSTNGDLAFFKNEAGKVVHVGILFTNNTIIHAAGKVRIDAITEKGIVRTDDSKLTHTLSGIRRFF